MLNKMLLVNRVKDIQGNWYAPLDHITDFKSVIDVEYVDQTSSAGDWSGLFFQKLNGTVYAIPFNQDNNWPQYGFTLYTGDLFASIPFKEFNKHRITEVVEQFVKMYY